MARFSALHALPVWLLLMPACDTAFRTSTRNKALPETAENSYPKLTQLDCVDPDLDLVPTSVSLTLCDGALASGRLDITPLTPPNLRAGVTIGSVTGTLAAVTDLADFKAENIRSGVTMANMTGSYAPPCGSDGETGCLTQGVYKAVDTSALSPWDLRKGKQAGGVSGKIVFSKSMAHTANFDRSAGAGAAVGIDFYDSVDDYNNFGTFPLQRPAAWDLAGDAAWERDAASDDGAGGGTAMNGACDGTEDCMWIDRLTQLTWARPDLTMRTWEDSITYCEGLTLGGRSDWRLPTVKELQQASIDSIWTQATALALQQDGYWSATTLSDNALSAWRFFLYNGNSHVGTKTLASYYSICERP